MEERSRGIRTRMNLIKTRVSSVTVAPKRDKPSRLSRVRHVVENDRVRASENRKSRSRPLHWLTS